MSKYQIWRHQGGVSHMTMRKQRDKSQWLIRKRNLSLALVVVSLSLLGMVSGLIGFIKIFAGNRERPDQYTISHNLPRILDRERMGRAWAKIETNHFRGKRQNRKERGRRVERERQ